MRRSAGCTLGAVLSLVLAGCGQPLPPDWRQIYQPSVQYLNATPASLPVRQYPDGTSAIVGSVDPGRGGLIQNCHVGEDGSVRYCRVAVGALNALGWVDMAAMAPRDPG